MIIIIFYFLLFIIEKKPYFELHCQDKGITTFFDWISFDNSSEYENKGGQILECVFDRVFLFYSFILFY